MDKREAFNTDIGHVEVDLKKKEITVDGKPLHDVVMDTTLMELLARDLAIDKNIMESMRTNLTALKTWLPGIGNRQARETFRLFIDDTSTALDGMVKQRNLQIITLARMEKKWREQKAGKPTAPDASAPNAGEPKSTSSTPSPSSAHAVEEPGLSPEASA